MLPEQRPRPLKVSSVASRPTDSIRWSRRLLSSVTATLVTFFVAGAMPGMAQVSSTDAAIRAALDRTTMRVATLAGNGAIGNSDGLSANASFVQPAGVLWSERAKTLFVTDLAGERVRAVKDGVVSTVAGGGVLDAEHLTVAGGYADGRGSLARFNGPLGMAVDPSGALLVADSANGVVRRIADGIVTTFAGSHSDTSGADGPTGKGSLHHPLALAYASDGSLYIADLGVGLRRLGPDGTLTTVAKAPDVTGVSVGKGRTREVVWFGTFGGLHRIDLQTKHEDDYDKASDRSSTKARLGAGFQLLALDDISVVYSDLANNTVRYLHEPDFYVGSLNSGDSEDAADSGMFRNGPSLEAKADAPMGLAILPGERIAFADSGDGRVRDISNFSTRSFSSYDTDGVPSKHDATIERIAVVGDSYVFSNVLWDDSIPGIVQNGLDAVKPPAGKRRFQVDAVRLTDSTIANQTDFITNYLAGYDGVVFVTTNFTAGAYPQLAGATYVAPDYAKIGDLLKSTAASLNEDGAFLNLLAIPLAFETAPWERSFARVENFYLSTRPEDFARLMAATKSSGVPTFDAGPTLSRLERLPNRQELYSPEDWHLNRAGNIAIGEFLLRSLLAAKPWSSP